VNWRNPSLTLSVAVVMVAVWMITLVTGQLDVFALNGGLIPARLSGQIDVAGAVPAVLTPITASFLHVDAVHIGLNLLMLAFCGRQVEPALGKGLLALAMLLFAYAAGMAEWAWNPDGGNVIIGASGVTSGLLGLYALIYTAQDVPRVGPFPPHVVRIVWLAAAWIGLQALMGLAFNGQIAVLGHVGGFVGGLLLARPLLKWRYRGGTMQNRQ
jgi:membrane associated rhomboid family serine protease